ncbi:hypothetical protein [Staphylococcus equorum]|uniref:hypothetical protein n=1 Tax=Staphylococcus equorum TaxID=246432 RepID=UPI0015B634DF|nr:hypothetical protein [Staphylococcus equorum]
MKKLGELKTSTLERKHKTVIKKIEQAHENANYDKLDELNLLRNKIEVTLEGRNIVEAN